MIRRNALLFFVLVVVLSLSSCVSTGDYKEKYYNDIVNSAINPPVLLDDRVDDDINGYLPEKIYVPTLTQAFCSGLEFIIVDGRIYSKEIGTDSSQWKLFLKTGLPHNTKKDFINAQRVVEISADADCLMAFSDTGLLYQCFLKKTSPEKPFVWRDLFGWPEKTHLYQNRLVSTKRAWAMGARRSEVLWYEDIYGNQHHYGTMGLETMYFLCENGQEIRFTDSGLPADFSGSFLGPERGSFIADNLSCSASTMFLINNAGEMYTRLIDFDTMGCDPMFYKYTYENEKQNVDGSDYKSNFTKCALPAEDWKKHENIKLYGKAKITKYISILQTGRGNFAREMRVAGTDCEGKIGYYYKMLLDTQWRFMEAPLILPESSFLSGTSVRGAKQEFSYNGNVYINGNNSKNILCSVNDMPLSEGYCTLNLSMNGKNQSVTLHPVEKWTYMIRFNPGLDGSAKQFFITIDVPDNFANTGDEEFDSILKDIFMEKDLVLFSSEAEATNSYFQLNIQNPKTKNDYTFFMSVEGVKNIKPEFFKNVMTYYLPQVQMFVYPEMQLIPGKDYSIRDRANIENIIKLNNEYKTFLKGEISTYNKYKNSASISRWGYSIVDLFTTVTFLNKIDYPKIKTATMFGDEIVKSNEKSYSTLSDSRKWSYEHLIELLDERIACYKKLIEDFDNNKHISTLNSKLKNSYKEYFDAIPIPEYLNGQYPENHSNAYIYRFSQVPLFPGFVLSIDENEKQKAIIIELKDAAKNIIDTWGTYYSFDVVFHQAFVSKNDSSLNIDKKKGRLEWDGQTIRVWLTKNGKEVLLFQSDKIDYQY